MECRWHGSGVRPLLSPTGFDLRLYPSFHCSLELLAPRMEAVCHPLWQLCSSCFLFPSLECPLPSCCQPKPAKSQDAACAQFFQQVCRPSEPQMLPPVSIPEARTSGDRCSDAPQYLPFETLASARTLGSALGRFFSCDKTPRSRQVRGVCLGLQLQRVKGPSRWGKHDSRHGGWSKCEAERAKSYRYDSLNSQSLQMPESMGCLSFWVLPL